ncbi:hypothetical protein GCM10007276_07630 [Agaricicola taiwanensis]|uniref:Uncharacterized protein n=1 Tax=Agaricicola taiwanensis TaxID=591372 RepID=A0A8J2VNK6_9RHOB|nr:hypothetical protein [Agaricicola taiwanensis]GGE32855.1 hypothetical protein GCM10007276_07630 [Agaricicola taiwanensis]
MTIGISAAQAADTRIRKSLKNGTGYFRSRYVNDENSGKPEGPTCYLIEQDPSSVIPAHFHQANQFQVMVRGGGHLGKREINGVLVHYTDAYTPYGPINSGEEGLHYFTLRDGFDPGARFMPEQRAELVRKHGHHRHMVSVIVPTDLVTSGDEDRVELIAAQEDGLEATLFHLKAGESLPPAKGAGGGQFALVLRGSLQHLDQSIEDRGCIYAAADSSVSAMAGGEGAEVILMQFPRPHLH